MKRLSFISAAAVAAALAFAGGASAASLPTFNIALNGVNGISVSGSEVTGAVTIVSTFSGKAPKGPNANTPTWGIVRLDDGVTLQQAVAAVTKAGGDLNALNGLATLFASAGAPGTVETVFAEPGNYVALNETGNGQPGFAQFVVTASASPATLPTPQATETSIEFGFRGPATLHDGELVRFQNGGYLVHMDIAAGAKNKALGKKLVAALLANSKGAQKLSNGLFPTFAGPMSPGGVVQEVITEKPGWYVQACFMNTQDGREHTQLGMERLIHIVK